jgi:hypothetical protein
MKKMLAAAIVCCSFCVYAQSQPAQAVGHAITERGNNNAAASASAANAQDSNLPAPDGLRTTPESTKQPKPKPEEIKEDAKKKSLSSWGVAEWTALLNTLGALVTAAFTVVLGRFTIRMAKTARDTATIAENSLNASLASTRAYIYATSARLVCNAMSENPKVDVVIRNYGKTPASIVNLKSRFILDKEDGGDTTNLKLPGFYLSEGAGDSWHLSMAISEADAYLIHGGHKSLELRVDIGYEDVGGARYDQSEVFIFSSDTPYGFLHEKSPCAG